MNANSIKEVLPQGSTTDRMQRIVSASLEVFSESSFRDATTEQIARRARVSKRDIYARFPNKHALLSAVIDNVLREDDENIARVILVTQEIPSMNQRLEAIAMALTNEVLSVAMGFLARLIASESIGQPRMGALYFENRYSRRSRLVSEVLSAHPRHTSSFTPEQAAEHFLALVTHLPYRSAMVGMRDRWDPESAQSHVHSAVACFLRAYSEYA